MPRTQTVTILFCDLVSSTERRARLGDDAADEFIERFIAALRDAVARHEGQEIKNLGDGLQAAFPDSAADAVSCAIDMHRAMADLDPRDPPQLRVGLSSGEVARNGSDWSGTPVVEAARLQAAAQPGQTLASAVVRSLVGTRRALRFRDVGLLTLKGLPRPLLSVEVIDEEIADTAATPPPVQSRSHRKRAPVIAAVAIALIAAAVGVAVALIHSNRDHSHPPAAGPILAPTKYTPRYVKTKCPTDLLADVPDASCGDLIVPQDRHHLDGKTVRLQIVRGPARIPAPDVAPTIDVGGHESLATTPVRDHSELIQIGDRGYGHSRPALACPEAADALEHSLATRVGDPTSEKQMAAAIGRCYRRLVAAGIDPGAYNLDAVADDTTDLMTALKIQHADLLSAEAESAAVFRIVARAPTAVRSVTLENPFPPGDGYLTNPVGDLAGAFAKYTELCAVDAKCQRAYGNLLDDFKRAYAHYVDQPTRVSASCACDTSVPPLPVLIDGPRTVDALSAGLLNSGTFAAIPAALSPTPADGVVGPYARERTISDVEGHQLGANLSYFCSYFVHTVDTGGSTLARRTYPEFVGSDVLTPWSTWCAKWNVPDVSGVLSRDIASSIPMFLMRGDMTPVGSAEWVDQLQRSLPNATVASFPSLGDDLIASGPPCLTALRRQFLADPGAKLNVAVASCVGSVPPIAFATP